MAAISGPSLLGDDDAVVGCDSDVAGARVADFRKGCKLGGGIGRCLRGECKGQGHRGCEQFCQGHGRHLSEERMEFEEKQVRVRHTVPVIRHARARFFGITEKFFSAGR